VNVASVAEEYLSATSLCFVHQASSNPFGEAQEPILPLSTADHKILQKKQI
jgi:hypothetical protein